MIVTCPACAARIRLDRQRLGGKRFSLRCSRCRSIFKAEMPAVANTPPRLRVTIGHGDPALCSTIRELLAAAGMECGVCHDAEELLRQMTKSPPQVAIVDVAIPGMYVFELTEKIRSQPALAGVRIILLSSVYNRAAYKRTPTSLYGADDYLEKHHLPDDLVPKIFALTANATSVTLPAPQEEVIAETACVDEMVQRRCAGLNSQILAAEEAETAIGEAMEKADRLARIIVADIALYSQEKVEEGIRSGNFYALLAKEIAEGQRLFAERIPPEVRLQRDFLKDALADFLQRRRGEVPAASRGGRT